MEKDRRIVKIYVGIPASGKSTHAKDYVGKNPNWVRVNRDDFRLMIKDMPVCEMKVENLITKMVNDCIVNSLMAKFNVIVDNTNLKAKYINPLIDLVLPYADVEFQIFDISVDKAIERDSHRDRKVGSEVIKRMYNDYRILLDTFNFTHRKKSKDIKPKFDFKVGVPTCAVFDIDGTLAHMNGKRGAFDWGKVDRDDVDNQVARMVKLHKDASDTIIIVSGRDDTSLDLTKEWLDFYEIPYDIIFMRKAGDYRKDNLVKKEIYENHIIGKYNIAAIYDDRQQVVDELRKMGLKVFQVEPGLF
jgi:predicted kinase